MARDGARLSRLTAGSAGVAAAGLVGYLLRTAQRAGRSAAPDQTDCHDLEATVAELEASHARLAAALAFKNDLTSRLNHDIAQPISSIASLAELLRADWDDLPDDVRLDLATKIDRNTQRLIKMMNDLQLLFRLDPSSVGARQAPVPLCEVVTAAVTAAAAEDEVRIDIDDELAVMADRGHVVTVLQNLLANALAYGEAPVLVRAVRHEDRVDIAVQDNGPGIADEVVFTRGAGLGLFIVRHLTEANGGSVRYEPADPRGARLVVTLEAAPI